MRYKDRDGNLILKETGQDKLLRSLYTKRGGRFLIRFLITKPVTKLSSCFLRIRPSVIFIKRFIQKNGIDMSQYEERKYKSYNDFFTRKIKEGKRPADLRPEVLISPCDGKATAFCIGENTCFSIKNTEYTVASLLKNETLASQFRGGICVLIRLTVDDYHRYCYVDDGVKGENIYIPGVLHTVNPVAAEHAPIYKENCREYTVIDTAQFGRIVQMEVGALIVGKILNYHGAACHVRKGQEKGRFEFGGSTVILLFQKNKIKISPDILENSGDDCETIVKMGEEIGRRS
ncbi:MAG: archaetidylserine decarboxylase [Clostridia bacterium]